MSESVRITVDGEEIAVEAGRTVAAALMLEQQRTGWRRTRRSGSERGLFCGIGVCFDCLATVDGSAGLRTCLVTVREGMTVQTDGAASATRSGEGDGDA